VLAQFRKSVDGFLAEARIRLEKLMLFGRGSEDAGRVDAESVALEGEVGWVWVCRYRCWRGRVTVLVVYHCRDVSLIER
jgi:hypothetical protein